MHTLDAPKTSKIPPIVTTVGELRDVARAWRAKGERIALVPTMGSLHAGHFSLVALAKKWADRVVVSIFVNPRQFGPGEDLERYPRDHETDIARLEAFQPELVYAPAKTEMYGPGFATRIAVGGIGEELCAVSRPHFFSGVATVVAKLLIQCGPDIAVFGEKDFQQLLVVRRMVRDLDIPTEIIGAPTMREPDGLAMSSRNAYLTPGERAKAALFYSTLRGIAEGFARGQAPDALLTTGRESLTEAGFRIDYLEVRHAETLAPINGPSDGPARVFGALWLGETRLIDNVAVEI